MTSSGRVDLSTLRELAQAATPGPWRPEVSEAEADEAFVVGQRPSGLHIVSDHCDIPDAFFIAYVSPDVVLALVEAVQAAEKYTANHERHPLDEERCAIWVELDDVTGMCHPVGTCDCGWDALRAALVPFAAAVSEGTT